MKAKLIDIGNSKGIRIPKPLREEAGLVKEVNLKLKDGKLIIEPVKKKEIRSTKATKRAMKIYGPGYSALAREWDTPEEDEAWAHLQ